MDTRLRDALLPGSPAADDGWQSLRDQGYRQIAFHSDGPGMSARVVQATILRAIIAVVFAVLSTAALFYSFVQAADSYSLTQHYRTVQGRVMQKQCASHLQIGYAFDVGGATYRGNGMAHKRCDAYRAGEAIDIYYSPENPGVSLNEVTPQQEWYTRLTLALTEVAVLVVMGLLLEPVSK